MSKIFFIFFIAASIAGKTPSDNLCDLKSSFLSAIKSKDPVCLDGIYYKSGTPWDEFNIKNLISSKDFVSFENLIFQTELDLSDSDPISSISGENAWMLPNDIKVYSFMVWRSNFINGDVAMLVCPVVNINGLFYFSGNAILGVKNI